MNNLSIKRFNKSVHNIQCIGPCYPRNKWILHPNTLEYITNTKDAFCPINAIDILDPETKKFHSRLNDECKIDKNNYDEAAVSEEDSILNSVLPYLGFDINFFIEQFYGILSYEDGITWIEKNPSVPLLTKKRIFEIILYLYGETIDIIDNRTTYLFIEIVKNIYLTKIYYELSPFISIDKTNVYIKKTLQTKNIEIDSEENIKNKKAYIMDTFINPNDISRYLLKYFKNRKEKWNSIQNHIENLVNDLIIYIKNIIQTNTK